MRDVIHLHEAERQQSRLGARLSPRPVELGPPPRVKLTCGSDIPPEPVDWLWSGYLPRGKVSLLGGAPGTGKTTLAVGMAATITIGGRWPDGTQADLGNVVIWSGEDALADTLVPRLLAAGADMSRVFFVEGVEDRGESRAFDPSKDVSALKTAISDAGGADMLIVDPIVSAVSGDSHKNGETRRALQPLVELASTAGACLLGITHFSKGTSGRDPLERITGSIAFGALPRVVMVAAREVESGVEDAPPRRILARAKASNGPDDGGFYYQLRQILLADAPIEASLAEWGDAIQGSARSILAATEADDEEGGGAALREAEDFLEDVLSVGPILAKEVQRQAKEAAIADRTLKRAKAKLGIASRRSVEPGASAHWTWEMPKTPRMPRMPRI